MSYKYLCVPCEEGCHEHCHLNECCCPCEGNPKYNRLEVISDGMRKLIEDLTDFEKSIKRINILNQLKSLQGKIADLEWEIRQIQSQCKHERVVVTPRGNTGNYDPYNDVYWNEYHCPDCDKSWSGDYINAH